MFFIYLFIKVVSHCTPLCVLAFLSYYNRGETFKTGMMHKVNSHINVKCLRMN